jgi:hypothetical protein
MRTVCTTETRRGSISDFRRFDLSEATRPTPSSEKQESIAAYIRLIMTNGMSTRSYRRTGRAQTVSNLAHECI